MVTVRAMVVCKGMVASAKCPAMRRISLGIIGLHNRNRGVRNGLPSNCIRNDVHAFSHPEQSPSFSEARGKRVVIGIAARAVSKSLRSLSD